MAGAPPPGDMNSLLAQILPGFGHGVGDHGAGSTGIPDPTVVQSLIGGNPGIADILVQSLNLAGPSSAANPANALTAALLSSGSGASQALANVAASLGMDQTQLLSAALNAGGSSAGAGPGLHSGAAAAAAAAGVPDHRRGNRGQNASGLNQLAVAAGLGGGARGGGGDADMLQAAGAAGGGGMGGSPACTNSSTSSPGPSGIDDAAVVDVKIPQLRGVHAAGEPQAYNPSGGQSATLAADSADPDGPQGMSKNKIREKNRQAQRRFRERQRTLIKELRVQVELLCKTVKDQQADLDRLQHENRLMKVLLQTFAKAGQGAQ